MEKNSCTLRHRVTQEDRDRAKKWFPNQTFTDADLDMLKGMGHLYQSSVKIPGRRV